MKHLKSLLTERKQIQEDHRLITRLIEQWKINSKAHLIEHQQTKLTTDKVIKIDFDSAILEEFLKKNLVKIPDSATKKEFEDMIGFYMEKTARREYSIQ